MTGKNFVTRCLVVVLFAAIFNSGQTVMAQRFQLPQAVETNQMQDRLALISDVEMPAKTSDPAANDPVPFAPSSMTADSIPPFAAYPEFPSAQQVSYEEPITFDENIPVEASRPTSIDECCEELTAMIAGNLDSSISLEAKKKMIETALKMVARNVALKAEAKITKLNADHALEMARMQGQMLQMRSMTHVADQIGQIAGPLYQSLEKSNRQTAAAMAANEKISEMFAQLGYNRIEQEARVARANRKRIQLTSPKVEEPRSAHAELVDREMARLQHLVEKELHARQQQAESTDVQPAAYHEPLQPRRQPLEPLRRTNTYYPR